MKTNLLELRRVLNVTLLILLMNVVGIINAFAGDYEPDDFIVFADANVKSICVTNWDTNGDGELSYAEAAAVTDIGTKFQTQTYITSFNELQYFTGLVLIPNNAFQSCYSLASITLPNTVASIGSYAFGSCRLTSMVIPNTVTLISSNAFSGCSSMTSVDIAESVATIEEYAFSGCSSLTSVVIPNSVVSMGQYAFKGCSNIVSLTLSNQLISIREHAFEDCSKLFSVDIPNGVVSIREYAFEGCSSLQSVVIPNSVVTISDCAFYGCSSLSSVTIPSSVTMIGNQVFGHCYGLASLSVDNGNTVYDSRNNCKAIIKTNTNELIYGCKNTVIPNTVVSIANRAFLGAKHLISLAIPNSVTTIGDYAFYGCNGLAYMSLPNSVTTIGEYAFYDCYGMSFFQFSNSLTEIKPYTFYNCYGLTSVDIPNSVATIREYAFYGCRGISVLHLPNSITEIKPYTFYYCYALTSVDIPNTVTSIGSSAFYNCDGLVSLELPNSVETIGNQAFYRCEGLKTLVLPSSLTNIYSDAFSNCSNLESITVLATTPPNINGYAYSSVGINIPVTVPCGTVGLYMAQSDWSRFTNYHTIDNCQNEITVTAYPEVCGTVTGSGTYYEGESITIVATPNDGYSFSYWEKEGEIVSESPSLSFVVTSDAHYNAKFMENIYIGEGPNTTNSLPTKTYYRYSYTQQIYTAEEMGGAAVIYDIALKCTEYARTRDLVVYIKNVDKTEFDNDSDWISVTANDIFYSGQTQFVSNGDWTIIHLQNPFVYDGISNVLIAVDDNTGTEGGSNIYYSSSFKQFSTDVNQALCIVTGTSYPYNYDFNPHNMSGHNGSLLSVKNQIKLYKGNQYFGIPFADDNVKAICVANWDTNGDGELSYFEAAAVTDLGEVFKSNYSITTFNELQYFTGLTSIGENAFAHCLNLTSVVLPNTINSLESQAFYDCRNLLSITIPAAVTNIASSALSCGGLESIIVADGNTVYDSRENCNAVIVTSSNVLFRGCKNTVIPNTVESIGLNAFSSCIIESIAIPASITYIDNTSFYACENLSEITVSTDNTVYDSRNNCNAIIETSTNILVAGSKTTIIPSTVTAIDNNAFSYRFSSGSYNITIPESVVSIGNNAYIGGYGIESITVLAEVPPTLGNDAFYNVPNEIPVNVPCGTRNEYLAADGWSEFTNINVDPTCGRQITVTINPSNAGSVTGAGSYDVGDICTLTATPESGYRFVNWTENNEVVSTNATYQFTVNANRDLVANFEEYVLTNHYVCDISQFADYMPVVAVVVIDGVEQGSETLEIGAFSGDECRGSKFAAYFTPTQHYIYQLPVYGEGGDAITFKLYNHDIQQELDITCTVELQWQKSGYGGLSNPYEITFVSSVNISATVNPANAGTITGAGTYMPGETAALTATAYEGYAFANWTEGGNVVSQNATYSFTVTTARELVANFNTVQSNTLSAGWNWYSTYIEQTGIDGLSMLEEGLGEHGELIMSRTGAMVENFEGMFWWGDLNAVTNEEMYEIKTNAQTNVVMIGGKATSSSHPITVAPGWNWIGYVSNTSNSIDNALSSLTSNEDDIIQSRNAFSSYFPGYGWYGDLENMTPGQGYMYKSNGTVSQTLVYPTASRSNESEAIVYHNQANYNRYRNVMDVMAKVIINGEPANSNRYELAAFVDGECRGRTKLQYVEPMDTYLAFITINGNDDETVTFNLYDEDMDVTYYASESNVVAFKANEVIGKFRTPYILCFNNAENVENTVFTVYPNPAANGEEITISFMEDVTEATLFVENELGLTVDVVKLSGKSAKVRLDLPSGLYILRVVIDGNIYYNKLIVK